MRFRFTSPPRDVAVTAAIAGGLALGHWLVLAGHLRLLDGLPGWFWHFIAKPAGPVWLVALLLAGVLAAVRVARGAPGRDGLRDAALVVLAAGLQYGWALLEGRGAQAVTDRIVRTGHAEFARVAARRPPVDRRERRTRRPRPPPPASTTRMHPPRLRCCSDTPRPAARRW